MKNILRITFVALSLILSFSASASSNSGQHVIQRIQVSDSGIAYFRPVGLGGWGSADCPDAKYAYIRPSVAAFDTVLSIVMASKLNGSKVLFKGTCNEEGTYFLINYAYLL